MTLKDNANGVSLIAAVFIIVVLAFMGVMFVSLINTSSLSSVNDMQSAQALYVSEGGIEGTVFSLVTPTLADRITCSSVTGNANLTNQSFGQGQFTVTVNGGASVYSSTPGTLNGAITNAATTITVNSTAGYTPFGRIMIDKELMDYSGITPGVTTTFPVLRGTDGTIAASHANGASVGQYQCSITSIGGVPSVAAPSARRLVTEGVQLQEGWAAGAVGACIPPPTENWEGLSCTSSGASLTGYECWATSAMGSIIHWDGASWCSVYTNNNNPVLYSISMISTTDGWAVGDATINNVPIMLRWNYTCNGLSQNGTWNDCSGIGDQDLHSVSMVSATDGWAVGATGIILRWNNPTANQWSVVGSPTGVALNSVSMILPAGTYGWAMGNRSGVGNNQWTLLNRNGGAWNLTNTITPATNAQNLNSVSMVSATDGWAVGAAGTILRWNNPTANQWNVVGSPTAVALNSVSMILPAGTYGWAVGNSSGAGNNQWTLLNLNGGAWNLTNTITPATNARNLNAVFMNSSTDGWAVGDTGTILRWNNPTANAWNLWTPPPANATMLRWRQTAWSNASAVLPSSVNTLNSVSMLSYADGWAVGNLLSAASVTPCTPSRAGILHWNGSTWNCFASPSNQNLNSVFMVSSTDGWAVGNRSGAVNGGWILLRWNNPAANNWNITTTVNPATVAQNLNAVSMVSSTDGWVVGNRSGAVNGGWILLRWNNPAANNWNITTTVNPATVAQNLNAVSMVSSTDGWVVGNRSGAVNGGWILLRWNNPAANNWNITTTVNPATIAQNLNSVFMISSNDGWAVGAAGTILRWNNPMANQWNVVGTPTAVALNSVYCVDASDCWAVGDADAVPSEVIIHWDGTTWSRVGPSGAIPDVNLRGVYVIGPKQRPQAAWQEVFN